MAKNRLVRMCQRRDDVELGQGTSGCDRRASQSREVIAVGVGDAFDQSERTQSMELTLLDRRR
jgi:hypothetical protein